MNDHSGTGDGERGEGNRGTETRQQQLRALFVDITGTDAIVDEQEVPLSSRYLDDQAVSAPPSERRTNRGLEDTIDGPADTTSD